MPLLPLSAIVKFCCNYFTHFEAFFSQLGLIENQFATLDEFQILTRAKEHWMQLQMDAGTGFSEVDALLFRERNGAWLGSEMYNRLVLHHGMHGME